jgi:hypothetical protein
MHWIALFDGQVSKHIVSPKLDELFKKDLNISFLQNCRGKKSGRYYYLLYPSVDSPSGVPDRLLALDMRRGQDVRVASWTDLNGYSVDCDSQGTRLFFGGTDGYVRQRIQSGELINVKVETHDLMGGEIGALNAVKRWRELKYSLNTNSEPLTMEVYIDDVLKKWPDGSTTKTLSGSDEMIKHLRSLPADWEGFKMRVVLSGAFRETFELYSPWKVEFDIVGDKK